MVKTRIIHKFRIIKVLAYDWYWKKTWWDRWEYVRERDHCEDYYALQEKRSFWWGYKTLEKSNWLDNLKEKMETLKGIYGEYS